MSSRYLDRGYPLHYWATEIEVVCPRCGRVGIVHGNPSWRQWHGAFHCLSCSHTLKTGHDRWQGPVSGFGSRPCCRCGFQSVHCNLAFDSPSQIRSPYGVAPCPNCQAENEVELKFTRSAPTDHAIDPFFGLELALKEATRHGLVWAYGAEHLHQLKCYVQASLRQGSGMKWGYFTRLPTWIKSAKNRTEVLRAIARLEKRMLTRRAQPERPQ